jgi:simple sugar transport system ATP-binding protein
VTVQTNDSVLKATSLAKRFGATVALENLDLEIRAGEVVALMGANGAGKSTLVKIVSGVHAADRGTLSLRGEPFKPASPQHAKRLGVATVHQSIADAVVPSLSIADNLLLDTLCDGTAPWRMTPAQRREAAEPLAKRVALRADLSTPLASLSLAGQQLVTLSRALATSPALLILDEPTASLSALESERLFALLDRLRATGTAILLISHRLGDLRRIADRVTVMRDGRIVADQRPPLDFDAAIEKMIGRPLAPRRDVSCNGARGSREIVFGARGLQLHAGASPFDFDIGKGEIVAIAGPVGGGKSRLARTIFGEARAFGGEMELERERWSPRSPADAIRGGVYLAGEDRWRSSLFPDSVPFASIAGTLSFPFLSRWHRAGLLRRRKERDAARAAIETFGVRCNGPDDRLSRLSGGNQQKVVLARWHVEPARLLLLDEPFQGVDAGARADIVDLLRRHAPGRATLVFVSDLAEAFEVADRVLHFDRSTLVAQPASSDSDSVPSLVSLTDEIQPIDRRYR